MKSRFIWALFFSQHFDNDITLHIVFMILTCACMLVLLWRESVNEMVISGTIILIFLFLTGDIIYETAAPLHGHMYDTSHENDKHTNDSTSSVNHASIEVCQVLFCLLQSLWVKV